MLAEELRGLNILPDWAVLVQLGHYLRKAGSPSEDTIPDNEMALVLTALRMVLQTSTLRWEARLAADREQRPEEEPEYEPSVPFDSEPESCEPFPA